MTSKREATRETFDERVRRKGGVFEVARMLRCSRSYVDMLRAGTRSPSLAMAARIEDALKIPMRAWLDDECADAGAAVH